MMDNKLEAAQSLMYTLVLNDNNKNEDTGTDMMSSHHCHIAQDAVVLLIGAMSQYTYQDKGLFCSGINVLLMDHDTKKSTWKCRFLLCTKKSVALLTISALGLKVHTALQQDLS